MYAIIAACGKQYKVENNSVLKVELLGEEVGATVKAEETPKTQTSELEQEAAVTTDENN